MNRSLMTLALLLLALARGASAQDGVESGKLTKSPKLVKFVEAEYPPDKKAAGITAEVLLSIEIDTEGRVDDVEIAKGASEDFDASALAAARKFVFEPAEIDGKPAPVRITFRYQFTIKEETVSLGPQVNFEGTIVERFEKRPLAGVEITLSDLGVSAVSGEDGRFAFVDVPEGEHQVELSAKQLVTVKVAETFTKGIRKTVRYMVEERDPSVDEEMVVRAPRIKKETVETRIRTEEARRVPGTQGDTLKVVQNLPGVGRSAFGSGALVVWGAAPKETRVVVDGVEIPALYHGGGLRSTVNADLVRSIDLAPGAYNAEYGRGIGGLVRVELRDLPSEGVHGNAAADTYDASAMVSAALNQSLKLAVAGRYSYLDRLLPKVTSTDVNEYVPIPRYFDYQARLSWTPRKDEDVSLVLLGSDDRLERIIASEDPSEVRTQATSSGYRRLYIRWSRLLEDGSSFYLVPSVGDDVSHYAASYGDLPVSLDVAIKRFGLRGAWRQRIDSAVTLSVGLDAQGSRTTVTRSGSLTLPAREGDVMVFGQPPVGAINADHWTVQMATAGLYGVAEIKLGPLALSPGFRIEPSVVDGDRALPSVGETPVRGYTRLDLAIEPRLQASLKVGPRLTFTTGLGLYHQPVDPEDLSSVFGNPSLGPSRAWHASAGFALQLAGTLSLEGVGFYKRMEDLVSRNASPTPPLAAALTQDGVGRTFGGQVMLRQQLASGFMGWVSYSVIRSERKDHPESAWRLFDYDQTHVLALLASYELGSGWEVGSRFRLATGMPRTPAVGALYDARDDMFQPIFGAQNSTRIGPFASLDLRVERAIPIGASKLTLSLDIQNVTNRKNPEEIIYNYDYSKKDTITGLPALVLLGVRWEI